jgi:hypothetical protein
MPKTAGITEITGGTWIVGSPHNEDAVVWMVADKTAETAAQAATVSMAEESEPECEIGMSMLFKAYRTAI